MNTAFSDREYTCTDLELMVSLVNNDFSITMGEILLTKKTDMFVTWTQQGKAHTGISCRSPSWCHGQGLLLCPGHRIEADLLAPSSAEHLHTAYALQKFPFLSIFHLNKLQWRLTFCYLLVYILEEAMWSNIKSVISGGPRVQHSSHGIIVKGLFLHNYIILLTLYKEKNTFLW